MMPAWLWRWRWRHWRSLESIAVIYERLADRVGDRWPPVAWLRFRLRRVTYTTVRYSDDRRLYYVRGRVALIGNAWLSAVKQSLPAPAQVDGWLAFGVKIQKHSGEAYWRAAYPFAFYKVPASLNVEECRRRDDDLVLDYDLFAAERVRR
jgi:hypothetical protein